MPAPPKWNYPIRILVCGPIRRNNVGRREQTLVRDLQLGCVIAKPAVLKTCDKALGHIRLRRKKLQFRDVGAAGARRSSHVQLGRRCLQISLGFSGSFGRQGFFCHCKRQHCDLITES